MPELRIQNLNFAQLRSFLDVLRQNAYGNFGSGLGAYLHAHRTGNPVELLRRGYVLFQELFADNPRLAAAADHAQKDKWTLNPLGQHQRVVLMSAGDDKT